MPRFGGGGGGGGRGVSSSASLSSNRTKDAATLIGLSRLDKNLERSPVTDLRSCQLVFDYYEECLRKFGTPGRENSCDYYLKVMASCPDVNKDPGRRTAVQESKELEESLQRKAIKAGFSSWREHSKHISETSPRMCRSAFKLYNECLAENKSYCDVFRNKCPQFEQAPKCHTAVDSTS